MEDSALIRRWLVGDMLLEILTSKGRGIDTPRRLGRLHRVASDPLLALYSVWNKVHTYQKLVRLLVGGVKLLLTVVYSGLENLQLFCHSFLLLGVMPLADRVKHGQVVSDTCQAGCH